MHRLRQLLGGKRRQPGGVLAASGSDLGHNRKVVPVGMKRLANKLVGHMGAVKIAGINVIYPRLYRFTQHRQRRIFVFWRTKNAKSGKLHRAIAKPFNRTRSERECSAFIYAAHADLPH